MACKSFLEDGKHGYLAAEWLSFAQLSSLSGYG
jgi:hypothetical protein